MKDSEWDKLFELMEKAINLEGLSAKEKGEKIRSEAESRGESGTLEEFLMEASDES